MWKQYWFLIPIALFLVPFMLVLFNDQTEREFPDVNIPVITTLCWTLAAGIIIGHFMK